MFRFSLNKNVFFTPTWCYFVEALADHSGRKMGVKPVIREKRGEQKNKTKNTMIAYLQVGLEPLRRALVVEDDVP